MNIYKRHFLTAILLLLSFVFYYKAMKNMKDAIRIKKSFSKFMVEIANNGYYINRDKFILKSNDLLKYLNKCSFLKSDLKIKQKKDFFEIIVNNCSSLNFYDLYKYLIKVSNLEILSFYYSNNNLKVKVKLRI